MTRRQAATIGAAALSLVIIFVATSGRHMESTYFDQSSSDAVFGSATPGTVVYAGVRDLELRAGDRITIVALETGVSEVSRILVGSLLQTHGALGLARASDMNQGSGGPTDLSLYRDLAGAEFVSADGPIAILIEMTTPNHDVDVLAPTLSFKINDGSIQYERMLRTVRVCSRPAQSDPCPPPEPPH